MGRRTHCALDTMLVQYPYTIPQENAIAVSACSTAYLRTARAVPSERCERGASARVYALSGTPEKHWAIKRKGKRNEPHEREREERRS